MNRQDKDILLTIQRNGYSNQLQLAKESGCSVGAVNKSLKQLLAEGYLEESYNLTKKAVEEIERQKPRRAIILAAGFGMRMVPINQERPKALLTIKGETLIERQIKHLQEVGIQEIYVIVGFMKECFEYLIDLYGVKLLYNGEYAQKNNLHSLALAKDYLENSYIVPCDIWCANNPFSENELYAWYMVSEQLDMDSTVRVDRKKELKYVSAYENGNTMIGIAYIDGEKADEIKGALTKMCKDKACDQSFWEETLALKDKLNINAKVVPVGQCVEINTFEQLRDIDSESENLHSKAIRVICEALDVTSEQIVSIEVLKKGMTNRSFCFCVNDEKYIMRIPGEGTDQLIDRKGEASVYETLAGKNITDPIVYMNPSNGYKITKFLSNARVCDAENEDDLRKCMRKLKEFHDRKLKVNHTFDIFGQIDFYESLWRGEKSVFRDYNETKAHVFALQDYINQNALPYVLTHIDAVPDNFLFYEDETGAEQIRLIDWEYAGMQDPHVDIAMFCIYSLYERSQVDKLIDIYFDGNCPRETRIKIYCYVAACGLLWSNWCEYKRHLGVEFGEYSLRQYRYAKEFYRIVQEELK